MKFIKSFIHRIIDSFNHPVLSILIIFLLPLIFFGSATLGLSVIVSGDLSGSDLLDLHYPFKVALKDSIGNFSLPLWNSYLSLGFPLLAEGQSGPFYPPNLLLAFLPPYLALNWSIILVFIIAGSGTYLYAKRLNFSLFAALISALIFMFSAFFVTRAKHLNMIAVACWVPFLFYLTKRLFEKLRWRWAIFLGMVLACQFLAGHPQMTFFSLIIFSFYFLFESWLAVKKHGGSKVLSTALLSFFLILFLGLALSSIQILPTLELVKQSQRLEWTYFSATTNPFHPKNLITFISPYYFGNPATGSYLEDITLTGIFWENCSYVGLLPLILVFWTFWQMILNKPRRPHFVFLAGLVLFSFLMMLGRFTPVFRFFWENVPGFSLFRFPTRFNLFLIFSFSLLAGFSAQELVDKLKKLKVSRLSQTSEEEISFHWPLKDWQTQILIFGFILIDLFVFAHSYLGSIQASRYLKAPETVQLFQDEKEPFRLWSVTQYGQSPYRAFGWQENLEPLVAIRNALPPNQNLEFQLAFFSDRGWFEGGLSSKKRNRLESWLLNENQDEIVTAKVLGMFNVKYILTFAPSGGFGMIEKTSFDLGENFALSLKIYENEQVMPRFYFVPEAQVIKNEEAILTTLADYQFLPIRTVILAKEPRQLPSPFSGTLDDFKNNNPLTLKKDLPAQVVIEANIKNHGFLVLSDLFYPGWKVEIDNQKKEILPANYLVRAVELTPGQHQVRFYYDPLSFKIGALISLATLVGLILFFFITKKTKKRTPFL